MSDMRISLVFRAIDAASGVITGITGKAGALMKQVQGSAVMREKVKGASDAAIGLGTATAAVGAGMVASLAAPIGAFSQMEETMTRARLPYMTKGGVDPVWKELEPIIERLGNQLPGTTADFGEMAGSMKSAGLDAKYIRDGGLEAAAALKILGKLSNEEAGFLSVQMGRALKVKGEDYTSFADEIQRASFASGIAIRELATAIPYMGSQLQQFDIVGLQGARGVTTVASMLKDAGVNGSEIGTALGSLMDRLPILQERLLYGRGWRAQEGRGLLQKYRLGDLGTQLFDKNGQLRGEDGFQKMENVVSVFDRINKSISSTKDKAILFEELLGDVAKRAGIAFTTTNWDAARKKIQDQADLQTRLKEVLKTLSSNWEALTGSVTTFLASAAAPLAPLLVGIISNLNDLMGMLTTWTKAHPRLTGVILGSVGVTGLLLLGVGGLTLGVGLLGKALLAGVQGLSDWKSLIALSRQAVRGLGTEAVLTSGKLKLMDRAHWGFSTDWLRPSSWGINGIGKGLSNALKAPFGKSFWSSIGKGFMSGFKSLGKFIPSLGGASSIFSGSGLLGAGKGLLGALKAVFLFPIKAIGAGIATLGAPVLLVIAAIAVAALLIYKYWEPIKAFFSGIWQGFKANLDLVMPAWDAFSEAIAGVFKALMSLVDVFVPVQAGQDGVNTAMERGKVIGEGLAWAFGIVLTAAKWVAQGVEAVVLIVVTLVDVIVMAGKTIWNALTGNWKEIGKDWSGFSDRFWKRLENSSMNPNRQADAPAKAVEAAGKLGKQSPSSGQGSPIERLLGHAPTAPSGGASAPITIHYSPKVEMKGNVSQEDKAWFDKKLEEHKATLVRLVDEAMQRRKGWNGAPA